MKKTGNKGKTTGKALVKTKYTTILTPLRDPDTIDDRPCLIILTAENCGACVDMKTKRLPEYIEKNFSAQYNIIPFVISDLSFSIPDVHPIFNRIPGYPCFMFMLAPTYRKLFRSVGDANADVANVISDIRVFNAIAASDGAFVSTDEYRNYATGMPDFLEKSLVALGGKKEDPIVGYSVVRSTPKANFRG